MRNTVLLGSIILFIVSSCAKDQKANVTFSDASVTIGVNEAEFLFTIDTEDGDNVTDAGIILSEQKSALFLNAEDYNSGSSVNYLWNSSNTTGLGHKVSFSNLLEYKKYYFKPYCVVRGAIQYGAEDSIQTLVPIGVTLGPAGGYVIYDDGAGGGIEMSLEDVKITDEYGYEIKTFVWGCEGTNISGVYSNLGAGENNTALILQSCTEPNIAAAVANNYEYNGYTDWYLPSIEELNIMSGDFAENSLGNFQKYVGYWSSSQSDANSASYKEMGSGSSWFIGSKNNSKIVRAVRTF